MIKQQTHVSMENLGIPRIASHVCPTNHFTWERCVYEGGVSELTCQSWRHFKEQRLELWGSVLFFFSQSLSDSPLLLLHLFSMKCQSNSEGVGCVLSEFANMCHLHSGICEGFSLACYVPTIWSRYSQSQCSCPLSSLLQPHRPPYSSSRLSRLYV